jgi:PAS domain S-box-containing protein
MRLQSKFVLALLPLLLLSLLLLGLWSANKASEVIHGTADHYLRHTLHSFVTQELERRHLLLMDNQLDKVPSFVQMYQKEAGEAATEVYLVWPGHIFAFDRRGRLVFDSQKQEASSMEAKWAPEIERLLEDHNAAIRGHLGGEFYSAVSFPPWDWLVFVAFSDHAVHQTINRIQIATLVIALGGAGLLILVLSLLFRRFVSKPISTLRQAADDIATQHYPESVSVNTSDELGALARDMESMSKEIRESQDKILKFTYELESMVEERTQSLKKSQARLARAQEIAQLGIWDWDFKVNKLIWSDEVFRIFGLEPGDREPSYEMFMGFVHPQDREQVQEAVDKALIENKNFSVDHRIVRPDGSIRVVSLLGDFFLDPEGNPSQVVGTAHDITERKIAEEEKLSREKLQGSIETAGAVCHELNQPLQIVMANMELFGMKIDDPEISQRLKTIEKELARMAEITAKLQNITQYITTDYMEDVKILDLNKASK